MLSGFEVVHNWGWEAPNPEFGHDVYSMFDTPYSEQFADGTFLVGDVFQDWDEHPDEGRFYAKFWHLDTDGGTVLGTWKSPEWGSSAEDFRDDRTRPVGAPRSMKMARWGDDILIMMFAYDANSSHVWSQTIGSSTYYSATSWFLRVATSSSKTLSVGPASTVDTVDDWHSLHFAEASSTEGAVLWTFGASSSTTYPLGGWRIARVSRSGQSVSVHSHQPIDDPASGGYNTLSGGMAHASGTNYLLDLNPNSRTALYLVNATTGAIEGVHDATWMQENSMMSFVLMSGSYQQVNNFTKLVNGTVGVLVLGKETPGSPWRGVAAVFNVSGTSVSKVRHTWLNAPSLPTSLPSRAFRAARLADGRYFFKNLYTPNEYIALTPEFEADTEWAPLTVPDQYWTTEWPGPRGAMPSRVSTSIVAMLEYADYEFRIVRWRGPDAAPPPTQAFYRPTAFREVQGPKVDWSHDRDRPTDMWTDGLILPSVNTGMSVRALDVPRVPVGPDDAVVVYVGADPDGYALGLPAGEPVWVWDSGAEWAYTAHRTNDGVLFGTYGVRVVKVNTNGVEQWSLPLVGSYEPSAITEHDGVVYVCSVEDAGSYLLRINGGIVQWKVRLIDDPDPSGWSDAMAADASGVWVADSSMATVQKFSPAGVEQWKAGGKGTITDMRLVDGVGLLCASSDAVRCLDPVDGATLWAAGSGQFFGVDYRGGAVYASRRDRLFRFDAVGGSVWDVALPSSGVARVRVVGTMVAVVTAARLLTFDPVDGSNATDVAHGLSGVWQAD